jgi:hypothetical protein
VGLIKEAERNASNRERERDEAEIKSLDGRVEL